MKKIKSLLGIGQISLAAGIILFFINSIFWGNIGLISFIAGLMFGLSLVLNLFSLYNMKRDEESEL